MMPYVIAYVSTAVVFFGLDYLWLSRVAIGFYRRHIGDLLLATPNFAAAGSSTSSMSPASSISR